MNESDHQSLIMQWAALHSKQARLLFAIPNGTHIKSHQGRSKAKREGLKSGVPDMLLPVPRGGFNGLFIELKKPKDEKSPAGKVSDNQQTWIEDLEGQGYMALACYGADEAIDVIINYLCLKGK